MANTPKYKKKLIDIGVRENKQLKAFCEKNGMKESDVINKLIRNYLGSLKVVAEQVSK